MLKNIHTKIHKNNIRKCDIFYPQTNTQKIYSDVIEREEQ
jgi:hypothetical protein